MNYSTNTKGKCLSLVLKIRPDDQKITWTCNRYCSRSFISLEKKECYYYGCKGRAEFTEIEIRKFSEIHDIEVPQNIQYAQVENKEDHQSIPNEEVVKTKSKKTPRKKRYRCKNAGCLKRVPKYGRYFCSKPCQRKHNRENRKENTRVCKKHECENLTISKKHSFCSVRCQNTHNKRMQRLKEDNIEKVNEFRICKKDECNHQVKSLKSLYCSKTCRNTHNKRLNRIRNKAEKDNLNVD